MTVTTTPRPALDMSDLRFAAGIPGFPAAKSFRVSPWGAEPSPFYVLECKDVIGLHFVACAPEVFFSWYQPRFGAEVYKAVEAGGPDQVTVMVILTLHARPEDTTANLLGPVVINTGTGEAVQAVLSGSGFEAQTPVVPPAG
jgi:flagellar assembly factor FliW